MNPVSNDESISNQQSLNIPEISLTDESTRLDRAKHEVTKAASMVGNVIKTFFQESKEQISEGDSLLEKIKIGSMVGGIALMAVGGQVADRSRVPESLNIPNAIDVSKEHGNLVGSAALGLGVYATQFAIGSAWGLGIRRFRKTADVFDDSYPGYKDTIAEENAGYLKSLWRQSVVGLGIGNTLFVAAEVLDKPEMTNFGVLKSSNRSAKRIGAAAMALGFGVLTAAEANYDRDVLWWSVPDVVDRLEKASTWVAIGVGLEVLTHVAGAGFKMIKAAANRQTEN